MSSQTTDGPPRAALIAALIIAVGAVVAVIVTVAVLQRSPTQQPVAITALPAPQARGPECAALLEVLPDELGDYRRAPVLEPAPPGTAAWRPEHGGEALILRCGLDRPAEFVTGAPVQVVDAVQWFRVQDTAEAPDSRSTWFAVDRPVYVALTLPAESGPTPIQVLSQSITDSLATRPPDPAPVAVPPR
ncbi:DUF3515 domain-containing protein [Mycobacterium sp. NAZ190054]|uniref:DUF3515 domain-containing protein n=1 Tax=Mycobacterium sp. NAZ190054 TaxID=1747766 RepID=UPI000795929C|nr:DUF3515 domain-containing protein [Mycobacterium sp. NAZ190054]KWX68058.1 hypothetical protein ASJ79_03625 [Mycobacterium sp. NAZ190054]